jgi:hypothetical protein
VFGVHGIWFSAVWLLVVRLKKFYKTGSFRPWGEHPISPPRSSLLKLSSYER